MCYASCVPVDPKVKVKWVTGETVWEGGGEVEVALCAALVVAWWVETPVVGVQLNTDSTETREDVKSPEEKPKNTRSLTNWRSSSSHVPGLTDEITWQQFAWRAGLISRRWSPASLSVHLCKHHRKNKHRAWDMTIWAVWHHHQNSETGGTIWNTCKCVQNLWARSTHSWALIVIPWLNHFFFVFRAVEKVLCALGGRH